MQQPYAVLAYYLFTPIADPQVEVARHHAFFKGRDATGRIYLSTEGINGQMSASLEDAEAYMEWLRSDARFAKVVFKVHGHHEHAFPRMTVKVRKQLVALDVPVDVKETAEHLPPEAWDAMLKERDEDTLVLDVRNDYEWEIGHFEGAVLPKLDTFRQFPAYAKALKEQRDPKKTRVLMYCTGGIRCELYSVLLKQEGFERVYQLDGGVLGYGLKQGNGLWRGKLFVFDDRLAVSIGREEAETISACLHCKAPSDVYYNCANMDCNALFLCCAACADVFKGCCCQECISAPRLRAYERICRPKPFRRCSLSE